MHKDERTSNKSVLQISEHLAASLASKTLSIQGKTYSVVRLDHLPQLAQVEIDKLRFVVQPLQATFHADHSVASECHSWYIYRLYYSLLCFRVYSQSYFDR